jgi:hypothetical protein
MGGSQRVEHYDYDVRGFEWYLGRGPRDWNLASFALRNNNHEIFPTIMDHSIIQHFPLSTSN